MSSSVHQIDEFLDDKVDFDKIYPYEIYRELHQHGPITKVGNNGWIATGHQEVYDVFRDERWRTYKPGERAVDSLLSTRNRIIKALAKAPLKFIINRTSLVSLTKNWLVFNDPPLHTRLRNLTKVAFTPQRIKALTPKIEEITINLLDQIDGDRPFDLVNDFAFPLPVAIIAKIIGIADQDMNTFADWSRAILAGFSPKSRDPKVRDEANKAIDKTRHLLNVEIEDRVSNPRDDIISYFVQARDEGQKLTTEEIIGNLVLLLIAGHETTVNMIANSIYALLKSPNQYQMLVNDRSVMTNAIEELLRFDPPNTTTSKRAREDFEFHGHQIKKHDVIKVSMYAANRDDKIFDDPDILDITRDNARNHLSFGRGIHYCLGAPLARKEAEISFNGLLDRFPNLRLVEDKPPKRSHTPSFSTFEHLYVTNK